MRKWVVDQSTCFAPNILNSLTPSLYEKALNSYKMLSPRIIGAMEDLYLPRGIFIALEGIDGSGTSTHASLLTKWLGKKNIPVLRTHEPTDAPIGKLIRIILRDETIPPATDALLFAADRVEHTIQRIEPALKKGIVVISDRYMESSIAYQSSSNLSIEWIETINQFATRPDLTILLDVSPTISLKRKRRRKPQDKFESIQFLTKVREIFLQRAKEQNFTVINAEGPISEVQKQIQTSVEPLLTTLK